MTTTERPTTGTVRPLTDLRATDVDEVGGKAAHLGELIAAGFPVPDGFVLPAEAHRRAMDALGLRAALAAGHDQALDATPERLPESTATASAALRSTTRATPPWSTDPTDHLHGPGARRALVAVRPGAEPSSRVRRGAGPGGDRRGVGGPARRGRGAGGHRAPSGGCCSMRPCGRPRTVGDGTRRDLRPARRGPAAPSADHGARVTVSP